MGDTLGKIMYSDETFSRWKIDCSDIEKLIPLGILKIQSESFKLVIGTCCFKIGLKTYQPGNTIYVLKLLKISSTNVLRPVLLTIDGLCESGWVNVEEPCLEFKHSILNKKNYIIISCHIGEQATEDPSGEQGFNGPSFGDILGLEDLFIARSIPKVEEAKVDDAARSKGKDKVIEDLKEALLTEKDSDVVLKVEGREFKAHRLILGLRSPVFSAMFQHEMKEKNSGVVTIEDCDPEIFPDFLHYVYTGSVENLSNESAPRLYVAADKYQLMELKEECLEYMKNNVSVDNFCDFMSLSLRHHETELTSIATQFFLKNASDIVVTPKWMTFLAENVITGNELIVKLSRDRGTK